MLKVKKIEKKSNNLQSSNINVKTVNEEFLDILSKRINAINNSFTFKTKTELNLSNKDDRIFIKNFLIEKINNLNSQKKLKYHQREAITILNDNTIITHQDFSVINLKIQYGKYQKIIKLHPKKWTHENLKKGCSFYEKKLIRRTKKIDNKKIFRW